MEREKAYQGGWVSQGLGGGMGIEEGRKTMLEEEAMVRGYGDMIKGVEGITLPGTWPTISSACFCHSFTFSASASGLSLKSAVEAISTWLPALSSSLLNV